MWMSLLCAPLDARMLGELVRFGCSGQNRRINFYFDPPVSVDKEKLCVCERYLLCGWFVALADPM